MKLYFHITLVSIFVYCNGRAQNNPWSRNIFPGGSLQQLYSTRVQSRNTSNNVSTADSTCPCQSGGQTCDCVLGCECTKTGDDGCSAVTTTNKSFSDVINGGPYMFLVTPQSREFAQVDNICFTYFNLTATNQTVVHVSIVFINGSNTVQTLLVSDGGPGVVLAGGPDTVFKDKTFGEVPGCYLNTVYRCFLLGDDVSPANRNYQYPTFAIGPLCSSRNSSCGETAVQTLVKAGYNQRYRILPGNLPHKCMMSQTVSLSKSCAGASLG